MKSKAAEKTNSEQESGKTKRHRRLRRGTVAMLKQARHEMAEALSKLQSAEEIEQSFFDLLTTAEQRDLESRWLIFKMLNEGITQREISRILGVSLCKITRGSRFLKSPKNIMKKLLSLSIDNSDNTTKRA